MLNPLGTNMKAIRIGLADLAVDCASAFKGDMPSNSGSAIAVPTPRRKVLRLIGLSMMAVYLVRRFLNGSLFTTASTKAENLYPDFAVC